MHRVDTAIGSKAVAEFGYALARLLAHADPHVSRLIQATSSYQQPKVVMAVFNAATEMETAWNVLRLANIPASQRQCRVSAEFVAAACLYAIPLRVLRDQPASVPVASLLKKHPNEPLEELMQAHLHGEGPEASVEPARLKAHAALESLLQLLATPIGFPEERIQQFRKYRNQVLHSAAHGSAELTAFHFENFELTAPPRTGAYFSPDRVPSYIEQAAQLTDFTNLLTDVLCRVANYIRECPS